MEFDEGTPRGAPKRRPKGPETNFRGDLPGRLRGSFRALIEFHSGDDGDNPEFTTIL